MAFQGALYYMGMSNLLDIFRKSCGVSWVQSFFFLYNLSS